MPVQVYDSDNLEDVDFQVINTEPDAPNTSGSGFNRSVDNSDTTASDPVQSISQAFSDVEITADLDISDVDIPSSAQILSLRETFDYILQASAHGQGNGDGDVQTVQAGLDTGIGISGLLTIKYGLPQASDADAATIPSTSGSIDETVGFDTTGSYDEIKDYTLSPPGFITKAELLAAILPLQMFLVSSAGVNVTATGIGTTAGPTSSSYNVEVSNWQIEITWQEGGPTPDLEITGNVTVDINASQDLPGNIQVDIDASSTYQPSDITSTVDVEIDASSQYGQNTIDGNVTVDIDGSSLYVLSTDPSGLYTLIPGQRFDRLYNRANEDDVTTIDVAIPRPFVRPAFIGG